MDTSDEEDFNVCVDQVALFGAGDGDDASNRMQLLAREPTPDRENEAEFSMGVQAIVAHRPFGSPEVSPAGLALLQMAVYDSRRAIAPKKNRERLVSGQATIKDIDTSGIPKLAEFAFG